ncbi:hypothetical protein NDI56_03770 [Haloarcula sp. S1CR25-12]|uniref:Type II toxin-antitoxin system HicB family antitoxin n=1 Tax=Haloarcula saliterrae TaxID=2950534 RepID=A0ABU2F9E4_9EURY|nr:hypothetical protein [Haloarcula sp. S1CR25-12]MDS0258528.1 hypothetical protein [Haloarcula sp. S1CR25-12]
MSDNDSGGGGGTTIGIWVGEDDTLVEEFDNVVGHRPDYSRSESIKQAMDLYADIWDILDGTEGYDPAEIDIDAWVRQAVLAQIRAEERVE